MDIGGHELDGMKFTLPRIGTSLWYDVRRSTESWADGVPTHTYTVIETREIDVQPVQWSSREAKNRYEIELGGEKFIPTMYGFCSNETLITAGDTISSDSGTTKWLCLRTYEHKDHTEFDLIKDVA